MLFFYIINYLRLRAQRWNAITNVVLPSCSHLDWRQITHIWESSRVRQLWEVIIATNFLMISFGSGISGWIKQYLRWCAMGLSNSNHLITKSVEAKSRVFCLFVFCKVNKCVLMVFLSDKKWSISNEWICRLRTCTSFDVRDAKCFWFFSQFF